MNARSRQNRLRRWSCVLLFLHNDGIASLFFPILGFLFCWQSALSPRQERVRAHSLALLKMYWERIWLLSEANRMVVIARCVFSNRLRPSRMNRFPTVFFVNANSSLRVSVVPLPLTCFVLIVIFNTFSSVVCACYSKRIIIHIKLPNDFLLDACFCEEKAKKNRNRKAERIQLSYVIRYDFWLRWDGDGICENDAIVEFASHTCIAEGREKKSKPITLRRTNNQKRDKRNTNSTRRKIELHVSRRNSSYFSATMWIAAERKRAAHPACAYNSISNDDIFHTN